MNSHASLKDQLTQKCFEIKEEENKFFNLKKWKHMGHTSKNKGKKIQVAHFLPKHFKRANLNTHSK
jgi:hypothetical protein